jgi:hypothetical protein
MREIGVFEEDNGDTMPNKKPDTLPLFEEVLAGGCVAALGTLVISESAFSMSLFGVTALAIVGLLLER